jgi:hypothetical protein
VPRHRLRQLPEALRGAGRDQRAQRARRGGLGQRSRAADIAAVAEVGLAQLLNPI